LGLKGREIKRLVHQMRRKMNLNTVKVPSSAKDSDPDIASQKMQTNLAAIQNWLKMENKKKATV
jgi:hypothetical protein